jgi:O-antigen/teichoic acid export membrane protein
MTIKARLLSGGWWIVIGKFTSLISVFIINAFLARVLTADDLGLYFLAVSLVGLLSIIGLAGSNRLIVRLVAERLSSDAFSTIPGVIYKLTKFSLLSMVLVIVFYWFYLENWLIKFIFDGSSLAGIKELTVLWIVLFASQIFISEALRGFHDLRGSTLFGGVLYNVILLFTLLISYAVNISIDLNHLLFSILFSLALNILFSGVSLSKKIKNYKINNIKKCDSKILNQSLYLLVTSVSLLLVNDAHLWILGFFRSNNEVGQFGAAVRVVTLATLPITMVGGLIASSVTQLYTQKRYESLQHLMSLSAVVSGVPVTIGLCLLLMYGDIFLVTVFGENYRIAATPLSILAIGHMFNAFTGSPGVLLMMTGHERVIFICSVSSALFGVTISSMLTSQYGMNGASAGAAATVLLHNLSMWLYSYKKLGIDTRIKKSSLGFIYNHFRKKVESYYLDNRFTGRIEHLLRKLEEIMWKARGYMIVDCLGDSHAKVFRNINLNKVLNKVRFRVVSVRGATVFGLQNPNSTTNAINIFREALSKIQIQHPTIIMLGEVDMGFLVWLRAKKHDLSIGDVTEQVLERYRLFIKEIQLTHKNIIVVSAPLPTISDGCLDGEVAGARKEVTATQLERTNATLKFNAEMNAWCVDEGLVYVGLDEIVLDQTTGCLKSVYKNNNPADHHYDDKKFANLLASVFQERKIFSQYCQS